jgi:hypothetical protein
MRNEEHDIKTLLCPNCNIPEDAATAYVKGLTAGSKKRLLKV